MKEVHSLRSYINCRGLRTRLRVGSRTAEARLLYQSKVAATNNFSLQSTVHLGSQIRIDNRNQWHFETHLLHDMNLVQPIYSL